MRSDEGEGARVARAYEVTGRVQGVGFRWWTRERAGGLGLVGDVRNRADGSVLVRVAGPEEALDDFERALRDGPPTARVDAIERRTAGVVDDGWTSFDIAR